MCLFGSHGPWGHCTDVSIWPSHDLNTLEQEIRCGQRGDALLTAWWMMSSGEKRKWYLGSDFLSISVLSHPPRRVLHVHLKNKRNNESADDRPSLEKRKSFVNSVCFVMSKTLAGPKWSLKQVYTLLHVASHHRCNSQNSVFSLMASMQANLFFSRRNQNHMFPRSWR